MRLLEVQSLRVVDSSEVNDSPILGLRYAILSHTWGKEEVTFQDLQQLEDELLPRHRAERIRRKERFQKLKGAAKLAAEGEYKYLWIDTCCIDKSSSAELSEAINSMYMWYEGSDACYAYLSDVEPTHSPLASTSFRKSRWFKRG
jgi:hypothetical protein